MSIPSSIVGVQKMTFSGLPGSWNSTSNRRRSEPETWAECSSATAGTRPSSGAAYWPRKKLAERSCSRRETLRQDGHGLGAANSHRAKHRGQTRAPASPRGARWSLPALSR